MKVNSQILVSIIVPVYNVEEYLDQCLESLTSQTLKSIEIICINDASTDSSLIKLQGWARKDNRIIVVDSKINKKQGGARNLGIKKARGIYLGFVDSDDFVSNDMYETLIDNSNGMTSDIIISSKYFVFKDNVVQEIINLPNNCNDNLRGGVKSYILLNGCRMWTNIVKRSLILDNDLFYPENVIYEDNANGPNIFLCAKDMQIVNASFYYYRYNQSSTTKKKDDMHFFDRRETAKLFVEHAKRLGYYAKFKEEIDYTFYRLFLKNTIMGCLTLFSKYPLRQVRLTQREYVNICTTSIENNSYYRLKKDKIDFVIKIMNILPFTGYLFSFIIKMKSRNI